MNPFYRGLRAIIGLLLRLFYRIEAPVDPHRALELEGPLMLVGNHPNGMVDPGLFFVLSKRHITFLAKAPLFSIPVLGALVKGLGALPVFRRQDDPTQMGKNAGTLEAAAQALVDNRCITLFPEGRSHSEPQLQELKTGAARIALMAAEKGARVNIVPMGLTYSEKHRFRSSVHVEVGAPISIWGQHDAVQLTQHIFEGLRAVTLNLEQWEDLPLLQTAEALYALKIGAAPHDPERLKAFARGLSLLRAEQPERFEVLKEEVLSVRRRLDLLRLSPHQVSASYRFASVAKFIARNLLSMALFPLFVLGMVLFVVPFWIPPLAVRLFRVPIDVQATIKVLLLLPLAPLWLAVLSGLAWHLFGVGGAALTFFGALPLALFTRYYFERRQAAIRDARAFLVLLSRRRFQQGMVRDGDQLASRISALAEELRPRVVQSGA